VVPRPAALRPAVPEASVPIAVLLALSCSVSWALANVYVQRAGLALGSLRALLYAQGLGCVLLLPLAWALDGPRAWPSAVDLGITAVGSAVGYYAMVVAFAMGSLSGVVPMITAWAVPAAIAGVLWTGEWPTGAQAVGGAMILVGAIGNGALAPAEGATDTATGRRALAWAAASAVGFGVMVAGTARLRPALGVIGVVPGVWIAQWALLAPVLLRRDVRAWPPRSAWPAIFGMAMFESVGFVAFTLATRLAPVAVVSPPASLSSLLTVVFANRVLREPLSPARWMLVLLAAIGTVVVALG